MVDPGRLLREAREALDVSQEQLARRAGVPTDAVAAIEDAQRAPSLSELDTLLAVLGRRLELSAPRRGHGQDARHVAAALALEPGERLRRSLEWNEFAGQLSRTELKPAPPAAPRRPS